ncbi:MAG: insulinase family protein [Deltaproteobacteria bacterium]|nr:insulinase family protein [Deltaproteobacteria bacterium]
MNMTSERFQVRHLDSGLEILHLVDPSSDIAAIQLWMKVGSFDEKEHESGMAHLMEHMLFKGTSKREVGAIAGDIEAAGGDINAWTSYDETVYHLVVPVEETALGLDVLSDAAMNALLDPDEIEREKEVVLEEIRRSNDSPSKKAQDWLFSEMYGEHPYARPILGTMESVSSFTRQDMLSFFRSHYVPSRALLVISGGPDKKPLEDASEFFAPWKGDDTKRTPPPGANPPTTPGCKIVGLPSTEGYLFLAFQAPSAFEDIVVEADLLATVLGQGESSRLSREIKRGRCVANDAYSFAFTPRDKGLLVCGLTFPPEQAGQAVDALGQEIRRLLDQGISSSELAKARRMIESEIVFQDETAEGRARKAGYYSGILENPGLEEKYLKRLASVTPDNVMQAAFDVFTPDSFKMAVALPKDTAGKFSEEQLLGRVRSLVNGAGAHKGKPVEINRPDDNIIQTNAGHGVQTLVQVDKTAPLVSMRLVMPGGLLYEDHRTNGFHSLVSSLLTRGSATRSGDSLAIAVESIGGALGGFSGRNSIGLRGEFLASSLAEGMSMLAECLLTPSFEEAETENEKRRILEAIRHREDNPARKAFRIFEQELYGSHPFSMDVLGTMQSISNMTSGGLMQAYGEVLKRPVTLAVVGDVDPVQVQDLAASLAEKRPPAVESEKPVTKRPTREPGRRRERREFLEREQSHVILGFEGVRIFDRERYELEILAGILGGQSGRLFLDLRDKRSLAYAVSAFSLEAMDPGYFALYLACAPDKVDQAIHGLEEHVERLVTESVSEDELSRVKRFLVGNHLIERQKASTRAAQLAFDVAYGLGPMESFDYKDRIEAVSSESLLQAARKILAPDRSVLAVLGPGKETGPGKEQVEKSVRDEEEK